MNCATEGDSHTLVVSGNLLLSADEGNTQFSQPLCQTTEVNNTLQTDFEGMRPIRTRVSAEITCAVCLIRGHSVIFTHYGNSGCPVGWSLVYNGLMVIPTGANVITPICATTRSALSSVSFLIDGEGRNLACSVCSQ